MLSRRLLTLALASALVVTLPSAAMADAAYDAAVDLTFPVAGSTSYIDDYHQARGGGTRVHRATDVMAPYGAKVHAAVGGRITFITGMDGNPPPYGYMISIAGDDGRTYNYIHLGRQDLGPSDAYAPGMRRDLRVERGQFIGINGCSGNASCSAPHLHFEIVDERIVDPYGSHRMNPFASLQDAQRRGDTPAGRRVSSCTGTAYAFTGDWDRSGRDGLGWWCDGRVRLRTAGGQIIEYTYGRSGDVPVVGDWNGDRRTTVAIVRDGTWHLRNDLSGGPGEISFTYGRVTRGDVPIAGSWNGDGFDTIGIIRDGDWHLRDSLSGGPGDTSFTYGRLTRGDMPLLGDWNADRRDGIGIVRDGEWHLRNEHSGGPGEIVFIYGRVLAGDRPVMGDWTGNGIATPGIVRDGEWHLKHAHRGGPADRVVLFPAP